jgi:outer membrane protein
MKRIITLLLLTAAFGTAQAQTADSVVGTRKYTLSECIDYAVEHSPTTQSQELQNKINKQRYVEAIASIMPDIEAGTSAQLNLGRGIDAQTNTYIDVNSFYNSYYAAASVTLFNGLSGINSARMARASLASGRHELQMKRDMLAYDVAKAFFEVQYNIEMTTARAEQLEGSRENLRRTERMEELGMTSMPDRAEIEAKAAADAYQLTRQKNLLAISIINLKDKMNFPLEETLDIAPYLATGGIVRTELSSMEVYEHSLTYLPKALAAGATLRASELSYKVALGNISPKLRLSGGYNTSFSRYTSGDYKDIFDSFKAQFKNNRGFYIGASLSVPIFNGFYYSGGARRGRLQYEQAKLTRDNTMRELFSEIDTAIANMNGCADEYVSAQKQTVSMQAAYDAAKSKYDAGLISAIDLNTTSNRLLEAKAMQTQARLNYYLANGLVEYYSGKPFTYEQIDSEQ